MWRERILKISHTLLSVFKTKFIAKANNSVVSMLRAVINKPIGILVIMVQIIRLGDKTKAVKKCQTIPVHNHQSSQSAIVYKLK